MLASITPLGERGRGRSWSRTVAAFFVGAAVGGAALGALAGAAAWALHGVPAPARWGAVAAVAVTVLLVDRARRLPRWRRQVDVRWLDDYRGWIVGLGYGAQLGAAVVTIVASTATWVMLLVAVGSGSFVTALLVCLVFALVRALPLLAVSRVTSPSTLHTLHRRLAVLARPVDRASMLATWVLTGGLVVIAAVA